MTCGLASYKPNMNTKICILIELIVPAHTFVLIIYTFYQGGISYWKYYLLKFIFDHDYAWDQTWDHTVAFLID